MMTCGFLNLVGQYLVTSPPRLLCRPRQDQAIQSLYAFTLNETLGPLLRKFDVHAYFQTVGRKKNNSQQFHELQTLFNPSKLASHELQLCE